MRIIPLSSALTLAVVLAAALTAACSEPAPAPSSETPPYRTDATIKDLMLSIIDGNADIVWNSVATTLTDKGPAETLPQTDQDWSRVRSAALTLAESANMLMIPGRRVARPGEKSETPGVELEPEEMDKLIAEDRSSWNTHALALYDAAMETVAAADARKPERVFEIGEHIELACEGCHRQYWYPNEEIPDVPVTIEK